MPKKKVAPKVMPEFKLRVVLQYLQNPERAKRICEENQVRGELLTLWHQEFLARAGQIFGGTTAQDSAPTPANPRITEPTREQPGHEVAPSWGVRISYERLGSIKSASSSDQPPPWLGPSERAEWETKGGVIVWDNPTQRLEVLSAQRALELAEKYGKTNTWQTEGIPITQLVPSSPLPVPPDPRPSQETAEQKTGPKHRASNGERIEVERMRLSPNAAPEFLAFLLEHEAWLHEMAEDDAKEQERYWMEIVDLLMTGARDSYAHGINVTARPLPWVRDNLSDTWVCDVPPNRGTIALTERGWFWQCCIEQPDQFKRYSNLFLRLEEAMSWTEQELITIQKAGEVAKQPKSGVESAKPKMDRTAYHIDSATLEPEHITYRVVIELEHTPNSFKTREMSFGKLFHYNEKFPSRTRIADELQLDPTWVQVEDLYGFSNGQYRILSVATFEQASLAETSAQEIWNRSGIHQLYKMGKVTRARYGVEEIETHYCSWQGELTRGVQF